MVRISGSSGEATPRIDASSVARFFTGRAERIDEVGPTRAVIYQDNHPDLAERRDSAERVKLQPLLDLHGSERLLDIGCGTGRWVPSLASGVAAYVGMDLTPGLITYAQQAHRHLPNVRFLVGRAEEFSLQSLGESAAFDRVLCSGVLIYLNDDDLLAALRCARDVVSRSGLLLFREPVAQQTRLTISEHYSEDLAAEYNAIYRTKVELMSAFAECFTGIGMTVTAGGRVFDDGELNNRAETAQEWFLVGPNA